MTTALTNRRSSVNRRQQHLLPIRSNLPFPTSPSLPGRRKSSNIVQASPVASTIEVVPGDSNSLQSSPVASTSEVMPRSSNSLQANPGASTSDFALRDSHSPQASPWTSASEVTPKAITSCQGEGFAPSGNVQPSIMVGVTASEDSIDRNSRYKENTDRNSRYKDTNRNSREISNKVRASHRNIVTSRRRADDMCSPQLPRPAITSSIDQSGSGAVREEVCDEVDGKFYKRHTADPPLIPPGVFITSVVFEDIEPIPSTCSSRDVTNTRDQAGRYGEHDPALSTRNTVGLQRVYMEGLDLMRSHVLDVEEEVGVINRKFHKVGETASQLEDWLCHITSCNQVLLESNVRLLRSGLSLEVIDSETRLVELINKLRADSQPDVTLIESLTSFWEEIRDATHELQKLLDKFSISVLQRLSQNYTSSHIAGLQVPVCQNYVQDIKDMHRSLDLKLVTTGLLLKCYHTPDHADHGDTSPLSDRDLVSCDLKAFPILGLVKHVCQNIIIMCQIARNWLARDESFMGQVQEYIRTTRANASHRERLLQAKKVKQKKVEKNFKDADSILRRHRTKLGLIEAELRDLELKMDTSKQEQRIRLEEVRHKASLVDFLKVTLLQTKKHCKLQTKRTRLLRQVKDLSDYMKLMEADMEIVQDQILVKSHEKILLTETIHTSEKSFSYLKSDLEKFSESLEELEGEVGVLSGQLLQLEIVHTMRTSPEILDNLADRPASVKLSRSLRDRIRQRMVKSVAFSK